MLSIHYHHLAQGLQASVTTQTFTPPEIMEMRSYDLMATPLIYHWTTLARYAYCPIGQYLVA